MFFFIANDSSNSRFNELIYSGKLEGTVEVFLADNCNIEIKLYPWTDFWIKLKRYQTFSVKFRFY